MTIPLTQNDKIHCPRCDDYHKFVRVTQAARVVDMDRRSMYNLVKRRQLHAIRVGGGTLRVCTGCLVQSFAPPGSPAPLAAEAGTAARPAPRERWSGRMMSTILG
jgi:hypothetical protein